MPTTPAIILKRKKLDLENERSILRLASPRAAKQRQIETIEYVEAVSLLELSQRVNNQFISNGWQPFDGTRHYRPTSKGFIFVQAVVKYAP